MNTLVCIKICFYALKELYCSGALGYKTNYLYCEFGIRNCVLFIVLTVVW